MHQLGVLFNGVSSQAGILIMEGCSCSWSLWKEDLTPRVSASLDLYWTEGPQLPKRTRAVLMPAAA